ncbi:MAG: hypothetical protein A2161_12460 [Candidatus Schekmanbacteria bacterium RBG_13_48_7]|uniref:THIF-type NAD/FAD binding fold domain-containing protein n=1 Tax=Candidatus Schekmanbacteria bacterium RBG_13_48_7 TaxID=1817878 RepID=A0A1F7RLH5_9BACT|nr:MAG: hypothetical protein A2161_12460 [Candidatus Schekmanbacteria bacterium RBG_13_48_7]
MNKKITFPFSETQIQRYSRHILLKQIGGLGQKEIMKKSLLVAGSNHTALFVSYYMAASGVKKLHILSDYPATPENNISKTTIINQYQWNQTAHSLSELNPDTETKFISTDTLKKTHYDIICNFSMNEKHRYWINQIAIEQGSIQYCLGIRYPYIYVDIFSPNGKPCVKCLEDSGSDSYRWEKEILIPAFSFIGAIISIDAVKQILKIGSSSVGSRLFFHSGNGGLEKAKLAGNIGCEVCGSGKK